MILSLREFWEISPGAKIKTTSPETPKDSSAQALLSNKGHLKYRPDIDGLRALAILFVVIYHAFPSVIPGGFIGVDIFFVISGFLISTIIYTQLASNRFSFVGFYIRRIKRIFPALFVVLAFCFAFGWFNLLADEFSQLGLHIAGGAGFIANLVLWNESGYFDNASDTKPLLHLWSLGIEEQFYFFWPILICLAWRKKINLLWVGLIVGVISFAINVYEVHHQLHFTAAFYSPVTRFWELMIGAILAYIALNQKTMLDRLKASNISLSQARINHWISIGGAVFLLVGIFQINKNSPFPGFLALLPTLGAALLIAAGERAWLNRVVLSNRLLVWIGLISFPLYLWHWPLLSFAHILQGKMPSAEIRSLVLLTSIVLSALTYYCIEKPIRTNQFNKLKASILLVLLIVIGYIGFNTYQRDGLTFRLNQIQFRLPPILQALSVKDPSASGLDIGPPKIDCSLSKLGAPAGAICFTKEELQKPALFLWGDSYAAHLLIGYEERFASQYRISRLGYNGCPPIMGMELPNRKNCTVGNEQIFERILQQRPAKLVIAANWTDYDWQQVEATLIKLKQAGIEEIDLIGPAPVWSDGLYKQLYLKYLADRDSNIPYRMWFGLSKERDFLVIDQAMEKMAEKIHVRYISIAKILCNSEGCITRFGDTSASLEAIDAGHFTKTTSRYVVSHFPGK
ncbi:acyltransferase family protein [Polynucleobacter tropicus]|uniref:acyltransferase family protein n=1 Tax=Polynucleobacter tropicus TaxID=1743174 RepID=UPI00156EC022|nr:acyltransferase family protein [Polynucleobacter tropicus]